MIVSLHGCFRALQVNVIDRRSHCPAMISQVQSYKMSPLAIKMHNLHQTRGVLNLTVSHLVSCGGGICRLCVHERWEWEDMVALAAAAQREPIPHHQHFSSLPGPPPNFSSFSASHQPHLPLAPLRHRLPSQSLPVSLFVLRPTSVWRLMGIWF